MTRSVLAVGLAALLLLAGCASGVPSGIDGSGPTSGGDSAAEMGQMNFYVSDEPNAMDDFEHLNVTISAVAFQKANASVDGDADATPENGSEDANETDSEDGTEDGAENESSVEDQNVTTTTVAESGEDGEVADKAASDDWVVQDVDNQTVDLTELKGKNATLLSQFDVPAGEYDAAMVYVSDVNATLKTGEQVNVKLPSEKLQVQTPFTIGANESVDFVFDISVHKAGNSGKYILKPVVSESGANVEKRVVDRDGKPEDAGEDAEAGLDVSVDGNVSAGETVTITVTNRTGDPVEGAAVSLNGEVVGETNADGQLTATIPDAEEVEIEVESIRGEGDLDLGLGEESDDDATDDDAAADSKNDDASDDASDDESTQSDEPAVDLAAAYTTDVHAGQNATLMVTDGDGAPVEDAVVTVNGEVVGETNADGELTFQVPSDADSIETVVVKGDAEVTLEAGVVASTAS